MGKDEIGYLGTDTVYEGQAELQGAQCASKGVSRAKLKAKAH